MNGISKINDMLPVVQNGGTTPGTGKSFSKQLENVLNDVNDLQLQSGQMAKDFATGKIEDIHDVTVASEKAGVGLEMVVEVRNKILEAYREIMRMQI
jgi:flagellar hook-basal body complex protein FliE